jgi:hypothetical protein
MSTGVSRPATLAGRPQSPGEEVANAVSHGLACLLSVAALPVLVDHAAQHSRHAREEPGASSAGHFGLHDCGGGLAGKAGFRPQDRGATALRRAHLRLVHDHVHAGRMGHCGAGFLAGAMSVLQVLRSAGRHGGTGSRHAHHLVEGDDPAVGRG